MPLTRTINLPRPELASTLPNADAHALSRLSDFSQVQAWTKRKAAEYNSHVSTLLTIYSSIAPVTTIPVEILQEIFALVPCREEWCDASWLLSLGFVCRRWHSVLLATSQYWVRGIHAVMDPDFYTHYRGDIPLDDSGGANDHGIARGRALFLARSAPRPLEIPFAYSAYRPGWKMFEGHFDRVTLFEVAAEDEDELFNILDTVKSCMKRLEKLRVEASSSRLSPSYGWEADDLPQLRHLEITSSLFCCKTAVPSLHTVILRNPPRVMESLPQLFDALKKCPCLATLCLELISGDRPLQSFTRVLHLPKLRNLAIGGGISDVYLFLSALFVPSVTFVELDVDNDSEESHGLALPNVLPRRLSAVHAHQMLGDIDRLCFYYNHHGPTQARWGGWNATVSMLGYVQGAQRLRVNPAFCFHSAGHFLQILALFNECRVAELALDLRHVPDDVDGEFWTKLFTALPDLCRLELLSPTAASRATKRDIAAHYLASIRKLQPCRAPEDDLVHVYPGPHSRIAPPSRRTVSLAWVLNADERDASQLDAELTDVEQVLRDHARSGARAERLELYVRTLRPPQRYHYWWAQTQALDVTQVETDEEASLLVKRDYVARLENVVDVVVVGGGWEFSESESEDEGSDNSEDDSDGSDEEWSDDDDDDDDVSSEGEDEGDLEG
ncbi:hypothetical protein GSI_04578 [Ganoderma sinense ZZ0214-1]|uniref:F-box domain-containing protein n=1 Tax=Ganoderma sinense ZZ0214-1 TaxID=1077348 RepID=A0A2G8SH83_9APHY|nr:hypothetical protein GSI_04578 [Ganoderma sinense ZZ0214-1]